MRIVAVLLQVLAVVVLVLGAFLLVSDPRLRDLVGEDLSSVFPGTKASEGKPTTASNPSPPAAPSPGGTTSAPKNEGSPEESPVVTEGGYTIAPRCALWEVEGVNLYYSPTNIATVCVQPPGGLVQAGSQYTPGTTQLPPNCAASPDSVVYCVAGGQLSPGALQAFYNRGEMQTPREPQGGGR